MTLTARQELLDRHGFRTGLRVPSGTAEQAAIAICDRYPGPADATGLLRMLGIIHPLGPAKYPGTPPRTGARPVPHAHDKRGKAR